MGRAIGLIGPGGPTYCQATGRNYRCDRPAVYVIAYDRGSTIATRYRCASHGRLWTRKWKLTLPPGREKG